MQPIHPPEFKLNPIPASGKLALPGAAGARALVPVEVRAREHAAAELERLYRLELGQALNEWARLRLACSAAAARYEFPAPPREPLLRARTHLLLARLARDGFEGAEVEALARCHRRPLAELGEASELAREALLACDRAQARIVLARCLLAEGRSQPALEVLYGALAHARLGARAAAHAGTWTSLADAHESRGCDLLALGASREAQRRSPRTPWPALHTLLLATVCAQRPPALEALARLDGDRRWSEQSWQASLARLRARVGLLHGGLPWRPAESGRDGLWLQLERVRSPQWPRVLAALS